MRMLQKAIEMSYLLLTNSETVIEVDAESSIA
jgi:hypothetical protein